MKILYYFPKSPLLNGCMLALSLAGCAGFMGCAGDRRQPPAAAKQFLLEQEPAGAQSIAEAQEHVAEKPNVVLVGKLVPDEFHIGGAESGVLVLAELPPAGHGHSSQEDADNCPFCKRRAANAPQAMVQFLDAAGKPLAIDPQKAFGISASDVIVVRGRAEKQPDQKALIVTADGIFVRK